MSGSAMFLMVTVCGFIWGGFGLLVTRAVRREGQKTRADQGRSEP